MKIKLIGYQNLNIAARDGYPAYNGYKFFGIRDLTDYEKNYSSAGCRPVEFSVTDDVLQKWCENENVNIDVLLENIENSVLSCSSFGVDDMPIFYSKKYKKYYFKH